MRARTLLLGGAALEAALALGPGRALAQPLEVTPIQVELTRAAPNELVTLHNLGAEPVRYQVSAFAWRQGLRGELLLAPTRDLLFFPGLLTVGPGERRNLRVAAAAPFAGVERTYRLFVEQLPGPPGPARATVRVLARVGIPVYLEPERPAARAEVATPAVHGRSISFVLRNVGNVRVRPDLVHVVGRDEEGDVVFDRPLSCWYVLAGGERLFQAEAPADGCARVRSVSAAAALASGSLEQRVATAGGVCGP